MQTLKLYLVNQTVEVQIMDPAIFTTRNRTVYSKPIKVYQGIDNPIQVLIKNQDQKTANVATYTVQVDIQDYTNNVTVWTANVNFSANVGGNISLGKGSVTVPSAVLANLDQRFYKLTTRTISNTQVHQPLYIDDNYGVPLDIEVLPGYLNP